MRSLLPAFVAALAGLALGAPGGADARARLPDLTPVRVTSAPATVEPGALLHLHARLANRGGRRAKRSTMSWYVRAGRARVLVGRTAVKPLRGGGRRLASKAVRLPATLAAGTHTVVACADRPGRVRERSERNNCRNAEAAIRVEARTPIPEPPPTSPPRDLTPPAIAIDQPAEGTTTTDQTPSFGGTSSDPGSVRLEIRAGGSPVQTLTAAVGADGRWSATASEALPVGRYTAVASQSDAAGNAGSASRTFDSPAVLLAAGDIASCLQTGDTQTAQLLAAQPADKVAVLGDNVYEDGTLTDFDDCYDPTWGFVKAKTSPAAGNHEYSVSSSAAGYFGYFGAAAGTAGQGWYSYDLGAWHVIVLNSSDQCSPVACASGPQRTFLQADLAAHSNQCTLAYWHHPLFTSDSNPFAGSTAQVKPFWDDLYAAGADVVLNGHSHIYERFGPQSPTGVADANGIRQFIAGTGGYTEHTVSAPVANSEALNNDTFGVLRLVLRPAGYSWQFLPVAGRTFTDAGSASCH